MATGHAYRGSCVIKAVGPRQRGNGAATRLRICSTGQQRSAGEETVQTGFRQVSDVAARAAARAGVQPWDPRKAKHRELGQAHQRQIAHRSSSLCATGSGGKSQRWINPLLAIADQERMRSPP